MSEYPFISYTYTGIKQQIAGYSNMLRLGILLISIQLQVVGTGSFRNTSPYISHFVSSSLSLNWWIFRTMGYSYSILHTKAMFAKFFMLKLFMSHRLQSIFIILVVLPIFIQRQANNYSNITQKLYLFWKPASSICPNVATVSEIDCLKSFIRENLLLYCTFNVCRWHWLPTSYQDR